MTSNYGQPIATDSTAASDKAPPRGKLITLSAIAGTGRKTLADALVAADPSRHLSRKASTEVGSGRRANEYDEMSDARFDQLKTEGKFVFDLGAHEARYGTYRQEIADALAAGRDVIAITAGENIEDMRRAFPGDVVSLYLQPNRDDARALETIRARFTADHMPAEKIGKMVAEAQRRLPGMKAMNYDYTVYGDSEKDGHSLTAAEMLGEVEAIITRAKNPAEASKWRERQAKQLPSLEGGWAL